MNKKTTDEIMFKNAIRLLCGGFVFDNNSIDSEEDYRCYSDVILLLRDVANDLEEENEKQRTK